MLGRAGACSAQAAIANRALVAFDVSTCRQLLRSPLARCFLPPTRHPTRSPPCTYPHPPTPHTTHKQDSLKGRWEATKGSSKQSYDDWARQVCVGCSSVAPLLLPCCSPCGEARPARCVAR